MTTLTQKHQRQSGILFDGNEDYGTIYLPSEPVRFPNVPPLSKVTVSKSEVEKDQSTIKTHIIQPGEAYLDPFALYPQNHKIATVPNRRKFSRTSRSFISTVSSGFILLSLFGLLTLFWPVIMQEVRYQLVTSHESTASNQDILTGFPNGDQWTPSNTVFSIVVPKIDAKAPIIANIDSSNESIYMDALKKGVAQAKGTCFPGMDCRMYLFAHSTNLPLNVSRYNAVFYLLRKLENGDQIVVYYYGKKYLYDVTGKIIVSASDTQYITERGDSEELILQTCDPPGTSLNRLLVFAKPKLVEYLK